MKTQTKTHDRRVASLLIGGLLLTAAAVAVPLAQQNLTAANAAATPTSECPTGWIGRTGGGCHPEYAVSVKVDTARFQRDHPNGTPSSGATACNDPYVTGLDWWRFDAQGNGTDIHYVPANPSLYPLNAPDPTSAACRNLPVSPAN